MVGTRMTQEGVIPRAARLPPVRAAVADDERIVGAVRIGDRVVGGSIINVAGIRSANDHYPYYPGDGYRAERDRRARVLHLALRVVLVSSTWGTPLLSTTKTIACDDVRDRAEPASFRMKLTVPISNPMPAGLKISAGSSTPSIL